MKAIVLFLAVFPCANAVANEFTNDGLVEKKKFSELFQKWESVAEEIATYTGLRKYCYNADFQQDVDHVLLQIHRYDSLLYSVISEQSGSLTNRKVEKALKNIEDFEERYKAYHLASHLNEECASQQAMERNYRKTKHNTGIHSYDNQVIVTEAYLRKYVKNISRLMRYIDKNLYLLNG